MKQPATRCGGCGVEPPADLADIYIRLRKLVAEELQACGLDDLHPPLKTVAEFGEEWLAAHRMSCSPYLQHALGHPHPAAPDTRPTNAQGRVLSHLARGLTDHEIADKLMLSGHTVRSHVRALRDVFGAPDRASLLLEALRQGWGTSRTDR